MFSKSFSDTLYNNAHPGQSLYSVYYEFVLECLDGFDAEKSAIDTEVSDGWINDRGPEEVAKLIKQY